MQHQVFAFRIIVLQSAQKRGYLFGAHSWKGHTPDCFAAGGYPTLQHGFGRARAQHPVLRPTIVGAP